MNKDNSRNIKSEVRIHPNQTKQLLIDPNYGEENIPIENLSIECDLSVYERSRSFIGVENDDQGKKRKVIGKLEEKNVPFNQGEKFDDSFSFTTNYTEVSDIDYDGKETLGITSVHVEYNSSYMPIVTIKLVDVKGKMFQMGKKGPYSPFFNFPYPLFELKIKGYYGKPVVYLLHMTTFNSGMDSENGNFNITCTFNGYTYAYLSDMLLGYLKAVPYTTVGREIMEEKKINDPNFVSFNSLYEYANKLYTKIENFKQNDKELQALALAHSIGDSMANIKSKLLSRVKAINSQESSFSITTESDLVFLEHKSSFGEKKSPLDLFTEYLSENILNDVTEHNRVAKNSQYTLSKELYEAKTDGVDANVLTLLDKATFLTPEGEIRAKYYGKESLLLDRDFFVRVGKIVKRIAPKLNDTQKFDLVILTKNFDEIKNKMTLLQDNIKNSEAVKQDSVFDELSELVIEDENGNEKSFDFNIKSYTKVLADHVDILLETIKRIDRYAESNTDRNYELLSNAELLYDIKPEDLADKVYGFPDYRKREGDATNPKNVLTDTWIGRDYPDIDEVIFIKELHQGLLRAKRDEEIYGTQLEELNTQWCGVNPFDSQLYTNGDNPWDSVNNTTGADGEIIRLLIMRAVTFLGITVRTPQPQEIKAMARLEANNLFRSLLNSDVKNFLKDIGNNPKDISNRIRLLSNKTNSDNRNDFSLINDDRIISNKNRYTDGYFSSGEKQPTSFENYVYIGGHVTSTDISEVFRDEEIQDGIRYFLPLYFNDNENNFKGETLNMVSNDTRIKLREQGNIFFGDYMGNHLLGNNKPDVGATYIQIHDPSFYTEKYDQSSYAQGIIESEKVKNDKTWEYNYLQTGNFKNINYNGRHGSNEFLSYTREGNPYEFYNYFYKDETISASHPELRFRCLDSKRGPKGVVELSSEVYSLFGSEFYYAQTTEGRAHLFLRSIHFKLKLGEIFNSDILNIFAKKAATIQVPYSWVLFIGSILRRTEKEILRQFDNGVSTLPTPYKIPSQNEFVRGTSAHRPHGYFAESKSGIVGYESKMDVVLEKLPQSVKNIFRDEFVKWVKDGGFTPIQDQFEMFKVGSQPTPKEVGEYFLKLKHGVENEIVESGILNPNFVKNYEWVKPIGPTASDLQSLVNLRSTKGAILNFRLGLKEDEFGAETLTNFLKESKFIVNATWRIWANDLDGWFTDNRLEGDTYPITFKTDNLNTYLNAFIVEFGKLVGDFNNDERRSTTIFGSNNLEEIYLTMYKNIKSINDKWISGENNKVRSSFNNLIETFKFIDRGYNDIGTEFKLNPMNVTNLLTSNYNHSFYSHISKILNKNNFDFIPMPNYVDLRSEDSMKHLFETYSYSSNVATSEPSFVCMYVGEKSNRLDVGDNFNGDGINFGDETELPDDFDTVPAIMVKYGDQNQSIFKSVHLDQSEYSETNESLMTTDQIATSYNNINSVGQNIFDVYNNRAYNAEVEMLGNAMMQPFLYFQLDNVPMFRGGYVITRVSHDIVPNHMTTKFKGNRVKFVKTKLLNKDTVFFNMIGNLSDIRIGDSTLDDLPKQKTIGPSSNDDNSNNENDEVKKTNPLPVITASMTDSEIYLKAFKPKGGVDSTAFDRESNTIKNGKKMTYLEIFNEVEKLTGVPTSTLKVLSLMESFVGQNKGVNGRNSIGYVGLMQFGYTTAKDLQDRLRIDSSFFNIPDLDAYDFYAEIDKDNKTLLKPYKWHSGTDSENNKDTNSWFDDFISTYAAAILALDNIKRLDSNVKNAVDVYLTHQQGLGGVRSILRKPNEELNEAGRKNLPPTLPKNSVKYNQQWYLGWAGHVEASARDIDENYEIIVGKGIV